MSEMRHETTHRPIPRSCIWFAEWTLVVVLSLVECVRFVGLISLPVALFGIAMICALSLRKHRMSMYLICSALLGIVAGCVGTVLYALVHPSIYAPFGGTRLVILFCVGLYGVAAGLAFGTIVCAFGWIWSIAGADASRGSGQMMLAWYERVINAPLLALTVLSVFAAGAEVCLRPVPIRWADNVLTQGQSVVTSVAFNPRHEWLLASGSQDGIVRIWDVREGRLLKEVTGHVGGVNTVCWFPTGTTLAFGGAHCSVSVWDWMAGHELHRLTGHRNEVVSIAISPGGSYLASGSGDPWHGDGELKLWQLPEGIQVATFRWIGQLHSMVFARDGKILIVGSNGARTIKVLDANSLRDVTTLERHQHLIRAVACSSQEKLLATAGSSGSESEILIWDTERMQCLRRLPDRTNFISALAFSSRDDVLAVGSGEETVRLWDAKSGQMLGRLWGHRYKVDSLSFSCDGKTLAAAGSTERITLWNVPR